VNTRVMSPIWLVFASTMLSLSWLLPNHSYPWLGFHGDAWAASILAVVAAFILWRRGCSVGWHWLTAVAGIVGLIPLLQFAGGMMPLFGVAWINAAYMLGFLVALLVGAAWEEGASRQCADFLFLAIGIAAIVSVGLQFYQLLDLDPVGPWTLRSSGSRHFANMAQPNQLASLLLLGVLACGWGFNQRRIGPSIAIGSAGLLLVGVAFTESRTGVINVVLISAAMAFWRRLAPSKAFLWVVIALAFFYVACLLAVPTLNQLFFPDAARADRAYLGDTRWGAWVMFLKAAANRPWFGFGWGQLAHAQFLMLDERIVFGGSFLQAHNLVLDLILWNGVPIGLAISAFLAWWFFMVVRRMAQPQQLYLLLFLTVLGVHAMLEYPLQYAYFLLPAGLVIGNLNVASKFGLAFGSRRWLNAAVLLLSIAALAVTVRDYFRAETSFYGLRFELKKIPVDIPRTPPEVLVLTQWRDYVRFARIEPRPGTTAQELEWMRGLVTTAPSAFIMYRFAAVLALNREPVEAQKWLRRICQVSPVDQCRAIEAEWDAQSRLNTGIAAVPWPSKPN
jgi:hypothetical protein